MMANNTDFSEGSRIKDSVRKELMRQAQDGGDGETKELERLKVSIEQVKLQQKEFIQRNTPDIDPPLPLISVKPQPSRSPAPASECPVMSRCWDYSRCSLISRMPVYLYPSRSRLSSAMSVSPPILTTRPVSLLSWIPMILTVSRHSITGLETEGTTS